MPDRILVQDANHQWQPASEKDLPNESALQQLIRDNPEVLPLDDLGESIAPLLVVGRETALANGLADIIAVDSDGLITIIECKLDRNSEVKRTVIGQVLGYASYLWGMTYAQFETAVARKYFDSDQCHRTDLRSVPLDNAMQMFIKEQSSGEGWNGEAFRDQLETNLRNGRFRLIIVVDKVNDEMQRTVEYLNACTGPNFDILCAELRYFESGQIHLLVPALIGKPLASKPRPQAVPPARWPPEKFFLHLRKQHGAEAEAIARRLLDWSGKNADRVEPGAGAVTGSFSALINEGAKRNANVFAVWTNATVQVFFQYVKVYAPFDREDMRREWLDRLNAIQGITLPAESIDRSPTFPLSALAGDAEFLQFTQVMVWVFQQLHDARDRSEG